MSPSLATQQLVHGDCTRIDPARLGHTHLMTDPPYAERVHTGAASGQGAGFRTRDLQFASVSEQLREYVTASARAAERWSLIYTDIQSHYLWEQGINGDPHRHVRSLPVVEDGDEIGETDGGAVGTIPWLRWSMPQRSGDRPPSGCELLVIGHAKGKMRWYGPGNLTALRHKSMRGDGKHPTQKPLDQALDLVAFFSEPGDFIYDPTAGFATLGVACALLRRNYVGCELSVNADGTPNDWFERGRQRLTHAQDGRLSTADCVAVNRFLASVAERSGTQPPVFDTSDTVTIPPEYRRLTKGKLQ